MKLNRPFIVLLSFPHTYNNYIENKNMNFLKNRGNHYWLFLWLKYLALFMSSIVVLEGQ